MKVEKKELVVGIIVGIVLGIGLGYTTIICYNWVREDNHYNEYQKELEFHEQVRSNMMNYRSTLDIEFSEYFFEKDIEGNNYLVWVKFNDMLDQFDYNYARLGQ